MRILKSLTAALLATAVLLSSSPPTPASAKAAAWQNYILNESPWGIGVIHNFDGNYTHGTYDTVLAQNHTTLDFWEKAEGLFIGTGYCGELDYWRAADGGWVWSRGVHGSSYPTDVDPTFNWRILVWRC
jgi:hypothetical protein